MSKKKKTVGSQANVVALDPPLGYKLTGMRVLEYRSANIDDIGPGTAKLGFNVRMEFGISVDPPALVIAPIITCNIFDQPAREVSYLKMEVTFPLVGLDAYIKEEGIKLPDIFMTTLIGIALGAARGVLYAKNFGTTFRDAVTPPIDIQQLIPPHAFQIMQDAEQQPA